MRATSIVLATFAIVSATAASAAPVITQAVFATPPAGASAPDSITLGAGSVWVSYAGGTDSTGVKPGNSTIVRYAPNGTAQTTFSFAGSVDGLNYNRFNNTVWALQNQDGNSSQQIINAATNSVTSRSYTQTSPGNGYDEAAFTKNGTFLSYTNPAAPTDAIVRQLVPGNPIPVTDTVTLGQTGLTAFDADSLKVAPNGIDLIQSGGDQGTLLLIHAPGTTAQTVRVLALTAGGQAVSGLDDTAYFTATSGTLYATQTKSNQVLAFNLSGLTKGSLIASIGSLNEIAFVDANTGALTPFATNLPGIHGLAFVSNQVPEPATLALLGLGLTATLTLRRRRR